MTKQRGAILTHRFDAAVFTQSQNRVALEKARAAVPAPIARFTATMALSFTTLGALAGILLSLAI